MIWARALKRVSTSFIEDGLNRRQAIHDVAVMEDAAVIARIRTPRLAVQAFAHSGMRPQIILSV